MLVPLLHCTTRNQARAARRWLLAVLALALLFSQGVGLLHRSLHVPAVAGTAAAFQDEHAEPPARADRSGLAGLFPHLVDESTCRLFDAVTTPGVAASVHEFVPVRAGTPHPVPALAPVLAEATWHFDARGPPAHS